MNDETQNADMPGAASAETGAEAAAEQGNRGAGAMAADLRELGLRFTAALKAAASTPEAQELRGEIRDGLSQMRDEIDSALGSLRSGAKRKVEERKTGGTEAGGNLASQVRSEVAQAVRNLSAALDKMAGTMAPGAAEDATSGEVVESEIVEEQIEA